MADATTSRVAASSVPKPSSRKSDSRWAAPRPDCATCSARARASAREARKVSPPESVRARRTSSALRWSTTTKPARSSRASEYALWESRRSSVLAVVQRSRRTWSSTHFSNRLAWSSSFSALATWACRATWASSPASRSRSANASARTEAAWRDWALASTRTSRCARPSTISPAPVTRPSSASTIRRRSSSRSAAAASITRRSSSSCGRRASRPRRQLLPGPTEGGPVHGGRAERAQTVTETVERRPARLFGLDRAGLIRGRLPAPGRRVLVRRLRGGDRAVRPIERRP